MSAHIWFSDLAKKLGSILPKLLWRRCDADAAYGDKMAQGQPEERVDGSNALPISSIVRAARDRE